MLVELWRRMLNEDPADATCGICGNNFAKGNVFAIALTDDASEVGPVCPVCLDYLNARASDVGASVAVDWPSLQDLQDARSQYPEPMYASREELKAAATDSDLEDEIYRETVVWSAR